MCGIGAIVSGIKLSGHLIKGERSIIEHAQVLEDKPIQFPRIEDLWEALSSRGPDHIGQQTIYIGVAHENNCHNDRGTEMAVDSAVGTSCKYQSSENSCSTVQSCLPRISAVEQKLAVKLQLVGSSLQLRGAHQVSQPLQDCSGNILVYNGEIFRGLTVGPEENDSEILLAALQKCCPCSCYACPKHEEICACIGLIVSSNVHTTIPQVLSKLRGPWAVIYWQADSQSLWFGRDAFGRRSLLVHWPSALDPRLVFTSVAPPQTPSLSVKTVFNENAPRNVSSRADSAYSDILYSDESKVEAFSITKQVEAVDNGMLGHGQAKVLGYPVDSNPECAKSRVYEYWEELPCGIYSVSMHDSSSDKVGHFCESGSVQHCLPSLSGGLNVIVKKHEWQDELLLKLLQWERRLVEPNRASLRAESNGKQICKCTEANKSVGRAEAYFCTEIMKSTDDAYAILERGFEREECVRLDCDLSSKSNINNKQELQAEFSLYNGEEAAKHFQSKDGQKKKLQHPNQGFKLDSMSEISTKAESESEFHAVKRVQEALTEAVKRRTSNIRSFCQDVVNIPKLDCLESSTFRHWNVPVAVLFSGGIDSMILAVLADQCLKPDFVIELLNVSFDGSVAPDRQTAIAGLAELQKLSPLRRWMLVEVDADLHQQELQSNHLLSLICPSDTYMDFNIGTALWFAARGDGWIDTTLHPDWLNMIRSVSFPLENKGLDMDLHNTEENIHSSCSFSGGDNPKRFQYRSEARILLVGTGADEQCAGYARYRTKFKLGGWVALQEEMKLDMQRIWKRNMGRDDRCIADNGKEARFPFLDEDVVQTMLDLPLWHIADLTEGVGIGDKKILRKVASNLGLTTSSCLPKRAIQFGSRIARESNRRDFGSNRAANRASAGSSLLRDVF